MRQHLSSEDILGFVHATASDELRAVILAHCETCEACGDRLAVAMLLPEADAGGAVVPARRPAWAFAAVAATVVLSVAVGSFFLGRTIPAGEVSAADTQAREDVTPERQAVLDEWAAMATTENLKPTLYEFVKNVVYPETARAGDEDWMPLMRAAVTDLQTDDYQGMIDKARELHTDVRVNRQDLAGWLGIALYLQGDTRPEVEEFLRLCTESYVSPLERACHWYLGNHLMRIGRPEEGVFWIATISTIDTSTGRMAKDFLETLPLDTLDPSLLGTRRP